ncbi:hypothetical protein WJX84_002226 [Apatococcus fuscideae]|uniref:Spindle assembly abnormal protein 6 N-terminal domain-containing protein n=1 Tax=Apatococcus fuscideae TaxID=2026836 RepID=A0AAW1SZB6_9CHLO
MTVVSSSTGWESFELQAASTLYWQTVPVRLQLGDREEATSQLTVRILSGVNRHNHNLRILRVLLSSEEDLQFLHVLEVTEEEFQCLKADQGILVDFGHFPGKIISLLQRCIECRDAETPRFQAVLQARGSDSVFKIVETNDFKQLPHIALALRPGSDMAIKQFLAFRLSEMQARGDRLQEQLDLSEEECVSRGRQIDKVSGELAAEKDRHSRLAMEAAANSKSRDAAALQDKTQQLSPAQAAAGQLIALLAAVSCTAAGQNEHRERAELEQKCRDHIDSLSARNAELDSDNRQLRQHKYELDTKVSELTHRLGTAEGNLRAKLQALTEKVQAQKEIIQEQNERNKDLEGIRQAFETRCNELREAGSGAEARAQEASSEVLKGNRIIERLSSEVRAGREKSRRKGAIISRQEEELLQRDRLLEEREKALHRVQHELDNLREDHTSAKEDKENLRSKLEESKQQLQGNEQMIRWLNNQVNEAQLQWSGPGMGPTPALPAPAGCTRQPLLPTRASDPTSQAPLPPFRSTFRSTAMQNLVPTSTAALASRSSLLTSAGLSSPLPGGVSRAAANPGFRSSGLTASSSFFPSHITSSATSNNLKPSSLPASASVQASQPDLTSSMTSKSGSFSSFPASGGPGSAHVQKYPCSGTIRNIHSAAPASTAAVGHKPAGIPAHIPSASPAANRKSAYGPGLLRLSSQLSGAGGVPSQLGQRFGTAVGMRTNNAAIEGNQASMAPPAQA